MHAVTTLLRLAAMRRRSGASSIKSLRWAAGLLWRDHQISRRQHIERSTHPRP